MNYMMFTLTKQPNGLRVLTVPRLSATSVTFLLLFPVGSRHENKRVNGVSHFVEHLLFKGTKKRPTTLAISKELDSIGAEFNAFTSKEYTGYYIKTTPEHADLACDVLSDILFNSRFSANEIERERKVIIEEIKMYEDNPLMHIGELFESVIFRGHALGRPIGGEKEGIAKMARKDIVAYFNRNYRLREAVFTAAGNISVIAAEHLAKKYFSPALRGLSRSTSPYRKEQKQPQVLLDARESVQQAQIALGFPAYGYTHKNVPALKLLALILGGNMSSRLFIKIRERMGLAYAIRASIDHFVDTGYMVVQAGVDTGKAKKAVDAIMQELKRARDKGVTQKELEQARAYLRGQLFLRLEESDFVANWYTTQALFFDEMKSPEDRLAEYDALTCADIKCAAQDVLRPARANIAVIGPYKDTDVQEWL